MTLWDQDSSSNISLESRPLTIENAISFRLKKYVFVCLFSKGIEAEECKCECLESQVIVLSPITLRIQSELAFCNSFIFENLIYD